MSLHTFILITAGLWRGYWPVTSVNIFLQLLKLLKNWFLNDCLKLICRLEKSEGLLNKCTAGFWLHWWGYCCFESLSHTLFPSINSRKSSPEVIGKIWPRYWFSAFCKLLGKNIMQLAYYCPCTRKWGVGGGACRWYTELETLSARNE
jgi:hypothetical protein